MQRFEGPFKPRWLSHAGSAPGMARFSEGGLDLQWRTGRWRSKASTLAWRSMLLSGASMGPVHALWWGAAIALRARSLGWPMLAMLDDAGCEPMKAFLGEAACGPSVVWEQGALPSFEDRELLAHGLEMGGFCAAAIGDPAVSNSLYDLSGARGAAKKIQAMADALGIADRRVLCVLALSRLDIEWEESLASLSRACASCPHGSRLVVALGRSDFPSPRDLVFGRVPWFDAALFSNHDLSAWEHSARRMRADADMSSFDDDWLALLAPLIDSGGFDQGRGGGPKILHGFSLPSGERLAGLAEMPKVLDSLATHGRLPWKSWEPSRLASSLEAKQIGHAISQARGATNRSERL